MPCSGGVRVSDGNVNKDLLKTLPLLEKDDIEILYPLPRSLFVFHRVVEPYIKVCEREVNE